MDTSTGARLSPQRPQETANAERNATSTLPQTAPEASPPPVFVPTAIIPLTSTYIPPTTCGENRLTMLPPPTYLIWANEPIPAANHTVSECFPPEFMSEYRSVSSGAAGSSVVPAMGGLACPAGYCTMLAAENNYVACCPSSYTLHLPDTTVDSKRPAYGGTCYSDFTVSSTYTVTAYNISGETNVQQWVASTSGAQAYAHPIDGFAASAASLGCATPDSTNEMLPSLLPSLLPSPSPSPPSPQRATTSPGVIAGITIGAVSALSAFILMVWLLLRCRRNRRQPPTPPLKDGKFPGYENTELYEVVGSDVCEKAADVNPVFEKDCTVIMEAEGSPVSPTGKGETKAWRSFEGPFEMSADTIEVVSKGSTGKDSKGDEAS